MSTSRFQFVPLFVLELRLMLKGQRLWWFTVWFVFIAAQYFNNPETARLWLAAAWVWSIFILSRIGNREASNNTYQLVFSVPRPVLYQLPASWLAAIAMMSIAGSGAFIRFLIMGETASLVGWMAGVLFIPSLALFLGVWTGGSKTFEVIFVLWMYLLSQQVVLFDFLGLTPDSPMVYYLFISVGLLAGAFIGRSRQIQHGIG